MRTSDPKISAESERSFAGFISEGRLRVWGARGFPKGAARSAPFGRLKLP